MMNGKKLMVFSLCLCMLLSSTACMKEETTSSSDIVNSSSVVVETSSSSEVVEETSSSSDVIAEESSSSEIEVETEEESASSSSEITEEVSSSSEVVETSSSSEVVEQPKVEQTTQSTSTVTYSTATYTEYSNGTVKYTLSDGKTYAGKIPQGAVKDNNGNYIVNTTLCETPMYYMGENPIDIGKQHNGTSFYAYPQNKGTLQNPAVGDIVYIGDVMYSYKKFFGKLQWIGSAYNPDVSTKVADHSDIKISGERESNIKWG